MRWPRRILVALAVLAASVAVTQRLYRRYLREWVLTWGATAEEAARRLPRDELLGNADIVATRAIEIDAPPSAIWPWLVQMGPGCGGAYTYDWIENLFGLNMHSADRIVPEWQQLQVGDVLRNQEGRPGMRVEILTPERGLANHSEAGDWVRTFALEPEFAASGRPRSIGALQEEDPASAGLLWARVSGVRRAASGHAAPRVRVAACRRFSRGPAASAARRRVGPCWRRRGRISGRDDVAAGGIPPRRQGGGRERRVPISAPGRAVRRGRTQGVARRSSPAATTTDVLRPLGSRSRIRRGLRAGTWP
jgi:hypothetical protein